MTVILDGLTFALFMASAAFLLEVSPWLGQSRRRRVLTVVLLAAVAINVAFSQHPWQAATLLGLSVVFAATETARLRLQLLAATAIGGPFLLLPDLAGSLGQQFFTPQRGAILLITGGLLVTVFAGSVFVEEVISRIKGLPASSAEAEGLKGAPAGGKVIGVLERTLVYSAVLLGHPEAVALVVAVKSVVRYPDFAKERSFAEYFLIGSLLSLIFALAVGYLVSGALRRLP
ncbi:MAG TPA: hypothetical protein VIG86_06195 [Candidatus Dormibacteraeota bacterium]|jgi:hypothetical protein